MAMNLVCAVLDRGPADLAEMAVLLAIADSADKDTGEAWPAQKTLARRSRQTDRSVRNVLARLRAAGWLTWEKRLRANGSQASNVYTLDLAKLGETPRNGVPTPRNDVPPPPEHGSAHAPEHGSALEPSQKKETARGRAARPPMRPAATGAHGRNAALGAVPSRVDGGKRQYQGPDGCWYKRPDCPEDAKAFEAWLIAGRSGHAAQAAGRS
jgi:hypothetical protein